MKNILTLIILSNAAIGAAIGDDNIYGPGGENLGPNGNPFLMNPQTGKGYNSDNDGAWGTDGTRLNRAGQSNTYFGSDGGIYEQQGNQIRQIGGFKQQQDNEDYQDNDDYQDNGNSNGGGNQKQYIDPTSRLNGNRFVPWH